MAVKRDWKIWLVIRVGRIALLFCIVMAILLATSWLFLTQPFARPSRNVPKVSVDPHRLETHVRTICEKYTPRSYEDTANLDLAAEYIKSELENAGGRVSFQPFEADGHKYRNVIAVFGPETEERIVVGAHYDAAGDAPAADDNASGVAGLIEIAYMLGKNPPPIKVELVAYTLEEPPYFGTPDMGSAVHARSLKAGHAKVRLMIAIEMIGYYSDAPDSQEYPMPVMKLLYPTIGNYIAVVGKLGQGRAVSLVKETMMGENALPVCSIAAPDFLPAIDFSDHRNYWAEGYDAVMVTDTSFFRNHKYHEYSDTPDTLDYRRMAMAVEGVYAAVYNAAMKNLPAQ